MYKDYCVNNDPTRNPGLHHEVHTVEHAEQLGITNYTFLGNFLTQGEALLKAKTYYSDADGCASCCPYIHKG